MNIDDPVYLTAAATGDSRAQASLAHELLKRGELAARSGETSMAIEYLSMADVYARLAAESHAPTALALLSAVWAARARYLTGDPVRSLAYREQAETLFGIVMESGDPNALLFVGGALVMLSAGGDDAAADKLTLVVDLLPPEGAVTLRQWAHECETEEAAPVAEERR